jgi:hypothetical protein
MKQKNIINWIKIALLTVLPLAVLFVPDLVAAQGEVDRGLSSISGPFAGFSGIGKARNITEIIIAVIRMLLTIAGALAVLFIIIGGFQYITSAGNDEQAEKGKKTLINAVIGMVLIILSYVIINVIVGTLTRSSGFFG